MEYAAERASTQRAAQNIARDAPDESASWIRDAVSQSEQHLCALDEQLNYLERRLDTVLTPIAPTPATTNAISKTPTPSVSHLRGRVAILNDGLERAITQLAQLRQRVEI